MNAGKLRDRLTVLAIKSDLNVFSWAEDTRIWGNALEVTPNKNLAEADILGSRVNFIIRQRQITAANAIVYSGRHFAITGVLPHKSVGYMVISGVELEPLACVVSKQSIVPDPVYNRPSMAPVALVSFPGYLVPRGTQFINGSPNDSIKENGVLLAPKAVVLEVGDVVDVNRVEYCVLTVAANPFRNQYSVERKTDT